MLPADPDAQARFFYLAILGMVIASGVFYNYRHRLGAALQHAAIWVLGPWGTPLITMPQVPQIPSRQSCSKAMGSLPPRVRLSLTRSNISRNDACSLMSLAWYVSKPPGAEGPACRQT